MSKGLNIVMSILKYSFLIILLIFTIYPVYWMFYGGTFNNMELPNFIFSLKPGDNIKENYAVIQQSFNVPLVLANTFFVAIVGTLLGVTVNVFMGYALAMYDFKYKKVMFGIFMGTMFLGGTAAMIPSFELIMAMNLYNTLWAIILPGIYSTYTAFLARQTLMDFPNEILQSGRIDGCGEFGIFFKLVIPNNMAMISTIALVTFMGCWNGYLWNLIVTSSVEKYTLQVALASIYPKAALWTYAPIKMLGASISIIPILIIFISMQKYFINSIAGAVKG